MTDVASVKALVATAVPATLARRFIPGHPMAGHESSGSAFARADMFQGAKWILCPPDGAEDGAMETVLGMIRHLRAVPVMMSVVEHDAHTALLSHLPHVLASALLTESSALSRPDIASGSWRDVTRVGGANPDLWADILIANRQDVLRALDGLNEALGEYRCALEQNDRDRIVELFGSARRLKA